MNSQFKKVRDLIDQNSKIILTTHVVPDGDAIGSVIAFSEYLKLKGKSPVIINHSKTPHNLEFLDRNSEIRIFSENEYENSRLIEDAELIFILDTNEFSRTKSMEPFIKKSEAGKICIDHHTGIKPESFTAVISNVDYPSNCSILYDYMMDDNEALISQEVASALYVGIMTDTGSFRYPRTDENVFIVCADLIRKGADPVSLYENIYATTTMDNLKLAARFIESLEFYDNQKVVVGTVTRKDFEELNLNIDHVEGFSSMIMNIKGVQLGVILVELKDNIKISFRSKGDIKVNELAIEYNGGGHKNAAGANVKDKSLQDLKVSILKKINKYLD